LKEKIPRSSFCLFSMILGMLEPQLWLCAHKG
jgi:hypothetical protein